MLDTETHELEEPLTNEDPIGVAARKPQARPMHELPGVVMPYLDIPCERNRVYPCLEKSPLPADFMIRLAPCDCEVDPLDEDNGEVQATCSDCLEYIFAQPVTMCTGCGTRYSPGHEIVDDVVQIRWPR